MKSRAAGPVRSERREDYLSADGRWRPPRPEGLARVLAKAGYGSRHRAEEIVRQGRVGVNGQRVLDPAFPADADSQLQLDGRPLVEAPRRYFAFHKPLYLDCCGGQDTLIRHLPSAIPGLEPVGRLDPRATGLVLVSNDHWWNTALLQRRKLEKEFDLVSQGVLGELEVGIIQTGMHLQNLGYFKPVQVKLLACDAQTSRLSITLRGAKIRQLRRVFHSLRHELLSLAIVRIGVVRLGDLAPCQTRQLTRGEITGLLIP